MKNILTSILIITFIFFSGQILAQKTNDRGGSKVKKEQKELKKDTKDNSKGKTNDKGGSDVKKEQKGNHKNNPVVDDKTKKDKKNDKKDKGNKNKEKKGKSKVKENNENENLSPEKKIEKTNDNIKKARRKITKAYEQPEKQKDTNIIPEEQYLKKKSMLS